MAFPAAHRPKLHSTHLIERLNGKMKRRTDVAGIFPPNPMTDGQSVDAQMRPLRTAGCEKVFVKRQAAPGHAPRIRASRPMFWRRHLDGRQHG